jgi:Kef-type K+ transport system membrane component KefB
MSFPDLSQIQQLEELAWPLAVLLAWVVGEYGERWLRLPRISSYAIVGFTMALPSIGLLPNQAPEAIRLLANIAFGLVLFEVGYRTNLAWLRANPWLLATGVLESIVTGVVVLLICRWTGLAAGASLLVATLAMATSPAATLRVVNERQATGQVTERSLHLSVLNCLLAVFAFKVVVAMERTTTGTGISVVAWDTLQELAVSSVLGVVAGLTIPVFLRSITRARDEATMAFALAVAVVVALAHAFGLSAVLVALAFGIVARHRRTVLNPQQRGFGTLGQLLNVLLFVFVATALEWRYIQSGLSLGLVLMIVRIAVKVGITTAMAPLSGITWHKGVWTGVAMAPLSVFVILVLEQTRTTSLDVLDRVAPLAAAALLLEVVGPVLVGFALQQAREVPNQLEA